MQGDPLRPLFTIISPRLEVVIMGREDMRFQIPKEQYTPPHLYWLIVHKDGKAKPIRYGEDGDSVVTYVATTLGQVTTSPIEGLGDFSGPLAPTAFMEALLIRFWDDGASGVIVITEPMAMAPPTRPPVITFESLLLEFGKYHTLPPNPESESIAAFKGLCKRVVPYLEAKIRDQHSHFAGRSKPIRRRPGPGRRT